MLRIIEGQPGSGKTYYAVQYLAKFCEYDKIYNQYILHSDTLLITNIDDIKVQHMHVDTFFREKMFHVERIKKYMDSRGYKRVIIIIDECQKYLSKEAMKQYKDEENDIYFFFEYHRHLGCDIFLICQTVSAIPKRLVNLSEYVIRARQSTVSLPKVFLYDALDSVTGDRLFIVKLTKSNDVFKLYRSFEFEESVKRGSVLFKKWIIGLSLFAIPLIIGIFLLTSGYLFRTKSAVSNDTKKNSRVVYSQNNPYPENSTTLTQNSQISSNTLTQNSQSSSNTLTQNSQSSSNTLTQNSQSSSNTITDICIFASCEYPKLRRSYAKYGGEQIAGRVCFHDQCYYLVQKYEGENEHVFARSEKSEQSSEQAGKKESLAEVPKRERHFGKETTEPKAKASGVF